MSTRASCLSTICLLLPLAAACDRFERSPTRASNGTVLESLRARDRQKRSLVLAGQLRTVDANRQTLIVAFDDDLYEFAYTDETEVVGGAANVQGLTGNRGNEVTVLYRHNPITSTNTAVSITLQ